MAIKQDGTEAPAWQWLNYNAVHNDLREFLDRADRLGEVKKISGASWDLEMAGISEMFGHERPDNPPFPASFFADITNNVVTVSNVRGTKRITVWLERDMIDRYIAGTGQGQSARRRLGRVLTDRRAQA